MRIGIFTTANSWHVPIQTKYFVASGHDVIYFQLYPGTNQPITPEGVKCIDIKSSYPGILNFFHKLFLFYRFTKNEKIDVLHIISMSKSIYIPFSKAKKNVIENNGSDVLIQPQNHFYLKFIYRILYKFADAVIQDSYIAQKAGIKYGAPQKNNLIIELGIDFNVFNERVKKGIAREQMGLKNEKIVFSPRGLSTIYNIDIIIKSIPIVKKVFPDIKYVFSRHFGSPETFYEKFIEEFDIKSNVIFTGFLDNEKSLPYYYTDADIVVSVPSSDSSPRSVYEAIACKKPVIISELPWYHNKFIKNKDVLVVPVREEQELALSIINYLNNEVTLDLEHAYNFVKNNLNYIDSSILRENLYKKILSE